MSDRANAIRSPCAVCARNGRSSTPIVAPSGRTIGIWRGVTNTRPSISFL
ncbi:MAG: hypothetical protein KAJ19_19715 [Gammaproteobacteria bacterium]|nr:hypothetical protein [Gammaproteobacteria bacterium]